LNQHLHFITYSLNSVSGQIPTFKKFYTGLVDVKTVAHEKTEEKESATKTTSFAMSSSEGSKANIQEEVFRVDFWFGLFGYLLFFKDCLVM
jgi:hypothetical protein